MINLMTTSNTSQEFRTRELTAVSNVERRDRTPRQAIFRTNRLPNVHEASRPGTMRVMLEWPVLEQQRLLLLPNAVRLPTIVGRAAVQ
jgi:hypothetical protein